VKVDSTADLKLGTILEDGSKVVSRLPDGSVLLARDGQGWHRERRWYFDWPSGDPRQVWIATKPTRPCAKCGHETTLLIHPICEAAEPDGGRQALERLLMAGARLVEDVAIGEFGPWHPKLRDLRFTVFDTETTGLHRRNDRILELAAIQINVTGEIARFETLIDPDMPIPAESSAIHGIYDEDVAGAPEELEALQRFSTFCEGTVLVAHNSEFDVSFLHHAEERYGPLEFRPLAVRDTLAMAKKLLQTGAGPGKVPDRKLTTLTRHLGIDHSAAHTAMSDVEATVHLLNWLLRENYRLQSTTA
jgi:DNA polymerase III epsilon subunit family exonuclease